MITKVYNVLDGGRGGLEEVKPEKIKLNETPLQFKLGNRIVSLREAASTSQFPQLLQSGLTGILFDAFNDVPTTFQQWCDTMSSRKKSEDWLRGSAIGTLPKVGENAPYPHIDVDLDSTVKITNDKYGAILDVTDEMLRFDQTGLIRAMVQDLGRAAKQTLEESAFAALKDTTNYYQLNSTTGDNDVGAVTGSTTFSATGLQTAYRTLITMKDRKSGRYLGVAPDTLICTPGVEWAAKQLLMADSIVRASAYTTAEVFGTGQSNPLRGMIKQIIVSPYMGTTYQWVLLAAKRAFVYQEVEPLQLWLSEVDARNNQNYFEYDRISYKVREFYGFGCKDQHYAYYSTATNAPAVT